MQGHDDIGQDHQAALLTAALTRQAAAAVSVGTYWAWETIATLPSARRRKALRRPRGGGEGRAYRGGRSSTACSHQLCALKSRVVRLINISSVLRHCCLGDRKCMRPVKRFFSGRPMTVTG